MIRQRRHGWLAATCAVVLGTASGGCRTGPREAVAEREPPPSVDLPHFADARLQPLPPITESAEAIMPAAYVADETGNESSASDAPPRIGDLVSPLELPESVRSESPRPIVALASLELDDVILSVQEKYPLLLSAQLERQVADGKRQSAWGAFDLGIKAYSIAAPEGFYRTYRNGVSLDQPNFYGGYLYGGYKIGDGNFQPWFGERETNEGGEFSLGMGVPLLKGRAIDKRREELFKAGFARQAVEPMVRAEFLNFVRVASQTYWSWVASGQVLRAQRELLRLAEARVDQIEERVVAGDLGRIARINNEQLIASRETKVIESQRKLQESAIKLSLFLRDDAGQPIVPDASQLPTEFPPHTPPNLQQLDADIAIAVAARPELAELQWAADQVRVELQQAQNSMLPKLDAQLLAAKDVGAPASSKGDKTPFELEAGLYGEVPLQRREAMGKVRAARGKLAQISAKRRFVADKTAAQVRDAVSALDTAAGRIERAKTYLELAGNTLTLGREQFEAGDIDLIALNIYEQSATDAQLAWIAAQADFFAALAEYRAALSLDPI